MADALAVPKGSLVLVTAANGYIGGHIADQFIAYGYRVRGTSRSQQKGDTIKEALDKRHGAGKYEVAVVEDFAVEGAFAKAMEGCAAVAHVASDMTFGTDPNKVITPVVTAMKHVLATAAATPSVKRFVYTSSSSATTEPHPGKRFHIDPSTWNQESKDIAWSSSPPDASRGFTVYAASKTAGEEAAWDFMRERKPGFVFNAVLPNFNLGPILTDKLPASTGGWVPAIWNGSKEVADRLRGFTPQYWVNVRDTAKLHVGAVMFEDVKDQRILGFTAPFNYNTFVEELIKLAPDAERKAKLPPLADGLGQDLSTVDTRSAVDILKRMDQPEGFVGIEQTFKQAVGMAD